MEFNCAQLTTRPGNETASEWKQHEDIRVIIQKGMLGNNVNGTLPPNHEKRMALKLTKMKRFCKVVLKYFCGRGIPFTTCIYIFVNIWHKKGMIFEWDELKNKVNKTKHGVSFDAAKMIFFDPHSLTRFDQTIEGEERWQTMGQINGVLLLLVVHVARYADHLEIIRIISARRPTSHERRSYENEKQETA